MSCAAWAMSWLKADDSRSWPWNALAGRYGVEPAIGIRRETARQYARVAGPLVRGLCRPPAHPAKAGRFVESVQPVFGGAVGRHEHGSPRVRVHGRPRSAIGDERLQALPGASRRGPRPQGNAMAIWQDVADDRGFPAGYACLRRFVSALRQQPTAEARPVITTAQP